MGNLTRDPEYGTTQGGINWCRFTVACQRRYKNANGQYDADFIGCIAWRQTADFVHKYFIKGNRIGVTGSIQTGSYTAQDGSTRYTTEVAVENVEFVGAKQEGGYAGPVEPPREGQDRKDYYAQNGYSEVDEEELPF